MSKVTTPRRPALTPRLPQKQTVHPDGTVTAISHVRSLDTASWNRPYSESVRDLLGDEPPPAPTPQPERYSTVSFENGVKRVSFDSDKLPSHPASALLAKPSRPRVTRRVVGSLKPATLSSDGSNGE